MTATKVLYHFQRKNLHFCDRWNVPISINVQSFDNIIPYSIFQIYRVNIQSCDHTYRNIWKLQSMINRKVCLYHSTLSKNWNHREPIFDLIRWHTPINDGQNVMNWQKWNENAWEMDNHSRSLNDVEKWLYR
jgi:hypothetical protein